MLGLRGPTNYEDFEKLCDNLNPLTGELLRPHAREGDRVGMDLTFNSTKSVGIARELAGPENAGDPRIEEAHREAVRYAMGFVEDDMQARVRIGGADHDRNTGNMVACHFTHRDTRISAEDQMPDMSLHSHVFVMNATFDSVEEKWKAAQMGQIKHDAPYYEAIFHNRLASNLKDLGYGIRRDGKSFEVNGITRETIEKFSRRREYIKGVAAKLGITSQAGFDKLGATTRLGKSKELADDLNSYYVSRLTDREKQQLGSLEGKPSYESNEKSAVEYAIGHLFERKSVVDERRLYETAIRFGIGSVTPEGVQAEAKRQGLMVRGDEATTRNVLAEEGRVVAFAREGRGTCRPMGNGAEGGYRAHYLGLEDRNVSVNTSSADGPAKIPFPLESHANTRGGQQPNHPDTATLLTEPQAGMTRLYREEPVAKGNAPEWVREAQKSSGHSEAEGRWFVADPSMLDWYREDLGGQTRTVFVDVPTRTLEGFRVSNSTEKLGHRPVKSYSRDPENEFFLPRDLADRRQDLRALPDPQIPSLGPSIESKKEVFRAHPSNLSPEQLQIARHVWESPDRVILIRGAAGTGKTHTMKATIDKIDRPVVVLAPSADASRGVLRSEGFAEADTVARFLIDEKFQETAKGGVIWVDEAGLLGIRQVREVFDLAEKLDARVVLQGDKRQHASVERGATLRVLEQFAGLPVAELKDIRRQKGQYKAAVESLSKGDIAAGYDTLADMGWVKETPDNKPLVGDYLNALDANKSVLVVAPTHIECDEITADIRSKLKERGIVGKDEKAFETMVPLHWTDAEKGDVGRYDGSEVMQFHRNSGTFNAGDRVAVKDWKPGSSYRSPSHFSVYQKGSVALAAGDTLRITANGKTLDGKHKLNNGATYTVAGFTKGGDILLGNGWTVGKDYKHLVHGYVTTSHASQGKTVDRVLIAMGNESRPAINAEQFYVSVSRGKEKATIYTNISPTELKEAIQRSDPRKSATELVGQVKAKPKRREKVLTFLAKVRQIANALRERAANAIEGVTKQRELQYER